MKRAGMLGIAIGLSAWAAPVPTFNKDVLPILQKHCQECHRPGEIAPMSLLTYTAMGEGDEDRGTDRQDAALVCRSQLWPFRE
jgi:hypothetical protein